MPPGWSHDGRYKTALQSKRVKPQAPSEAERQDRTTIAAAVAASSPVTNW